MFVNAHMLRLGAAIIAGSAAMMAGAGRAGAQLTSLPLGWHEGGAHELYLMGTDAARRPGGNGFVVASIKSTVSNPHGAGSIQQSIRAEDYLGKRVRLTGWLKTGPHVADGIGSAHLWLRVDGDGTAISSDFMWARPVVMGTEWKEYTLVLDVPQNARGLTFGLCLDGAGQVWADDLTLDVVGLDVATTGRPGGMNGEKAATADSRREMTAAYRNASLKPMNMDFETHAVASAARW